MFISVIVVRGILAELQSRGLDSEHVLRASELPRERIADIRQYVTFEELERVVLQAIAWTDDPGLGLGVGARAPEAMLQVFGQLILAHSTMREAFASWQRYSVLVTDATSFRLLEQGELARFVCEPPRPSIATRVLMDLTLAITLRIGLHFMHGLSDLHEVHFRHAAPGYVARYHEYFQCPVRFAQEHNALIFPRELLDRPQLHADYTVRAMLSEAVELLLRERTQGRSLAERVRALLLCPEAFATVDAAVAARRLGVSRRTLRRRLQADGTSFPALLDEARCRIACRALRQSDATVREIAEMLDFSEPSAFYRAFKRWTGCSPSAYTKLARGEHDERPRSETFQPVLQRSEAQ